MSTQFNEEETRSSCWLERRVLLEKEMARTETRHLSRSLIMKSIECFSKDSGLILKVGRGGEVNPGGFKAVE